MHADQDLLGTRVKMWNAQQSWFWLVISTDSERAATGAAPTEAQAIRDANMMAEEMKLRRSDNLSLTAQVMRPAFRGHDSIDQLASHWEASFANLKRYLDCHDCVSA